MSTDATRSTGALLVPLATATVPAAAPDAVADPPPQAPGAWGALELCLWCWLLLLVVNTGIAVVGVALRSVAPDMTAPALVLALGSVLAVVPVLVVGWPAGVLLTWVLRADQRESRHVLVFAVVGALTAVVLGMVGRTTAPDLALSALLAVQGAIGAGGGRLLTGWSRRRRAARRTAHQDAAGGTVGA